MKTVLFTSRFSRTYVIYINNSFTVPQKITMIQVFSFCSLHISIVLSFCRHSTILYESHHLLSMATSLHNALFNQPVLVPFRSLLSIIEADYSFPPAFLLLSPYIKQCILRISSRLEPWVA